MNTTSNQNSIPWKLYISRTTEIVLGFCMATFSLAMYFLHGGIHYFFSLMVMVFLYGIIIILLLHRIIKNFSLPALMLMIPIVPLLVLLLVISLLPILQMLKPF